MVSQGSDQERQVTTPSELGAALAELRTQRRKTQFELSTSLGIDRSQLAHLEGGRSGRFLAHLLNILDHLGAELRIHWPAEVSPSAHEAHEAHNAHDAHDAHEAHDPALQAIDAKTDAEAKTEIQTETESGSAQLTKITNLAMNVMAASQQLTAPPTRPQPVTPTTP